MIISALLLVMSGILLFYNSSENNRVEEGNLKSVTELEKIFDQELTKKRKNDDYIPESRISININGQNYIGIIYVPTLNNLALPVIETCTESNLKVSVCKYSGSIQEGNFVIAGHNYKSSFGKLSKLSIGNIIYFKDANGAVYKYTCKIIETLSPNAVDEMTTGNWDMTLFTCTYNNAKRLAYRFEQI